ncbi:MAG: Zn-dependent hydrolase [Geminicoccaceae bacterium]|nr:Zn-dependent hydrolase [Geminicoccaceae bacterium]
MTPAIDLDRLRADMLELARIGTLAGRPGVNRPSFSDADMAGRRFFMERCRDAGLAPTMDTVGNVVARWDAGSGPAVMAGSHLDTVPDGGVFDGTLGTCAALEAVRAMRAAGIHMKRPVEVVATADEEGRFGGMLGSQALAGTVDPLWLEAATDSDGVRLVDAMRAQGLDPDRYAEARRDPAGLHAFLELHIEQGPVLEAAGLAIGIATGVSGVFNWTVTLAGVANHSGTTPMSLRRDAFAGLASFAARLPGVIAALGSDQARLTIGKVELRPNFPHTIPGHATFSIIGRDTDDAVMRRMAELCRRELGKAASSHGLALDIREESRLAPVELAADVAAMLAARSRHLGYATTTLPSGAGHDAQTMQHVTRAGLIFVPSKGGISHAPEEDTDWRDVERGANVLLHGLIALAA